MTDAATLIRDADVVVAWDAAERRHVYLTGADVAWDAGGAITAVGRGAGAGDGPPPEGTTVVDGRGLMVVPGLVNVHSHPSSEPLNKGLLDELGSPGLYNSSLYEFMPLFRADAEAVPDCATVALSELLLSGVTTVVDLSVAYPGWLDLLAESGLRAVAAPMFRSARWLTRNGHVVEYEWDEAAGERAMDEALSVVDRAAQHECGRLSGMVAPAQIDTCTPALMREAAEEARARRLPWQIHAAQSVVEFHEITRRHGMSPVAWLDSMGLLHDRAIIGHAIFLDDHPSTPWHTRSDLDRLADTGTTVAHCPVVFARRGITLRTAGRYVRRGVNLGIGTDTFPHNMLDEMRLAAYLARTQGNGPRELTTTELFEAATVGGARALGREDIGRLAPGCRADLVLVDMTHPQMRPARDPLRSLIYSAGDRAVRAVFVDGREVVREGRVLTMDHAAAAERLEEAQRRVLARAPAADYAGRTVEQMSPPVLPWR